MEGICIKKKVTILTFILMAAVFLMAGKLTVRAAGTEITPIGVGEQVSGTLATNKDSKWYSFNISERGYFTVDFSPAVAISDTYWCVRLYDMNYNKIKEYDMTKGFTSLKVSNYIGANYYVEVAAGIAYGAGGVPYNLKVNFNADQLWENDNNDSEATATDIVLNSDMKGILDYSQGNYDVDVYKLTIPAQKGYFNINLKHADIADSYYYYFELYTANGEELYSEVTGSINIDTLSFKPGSVLYIKISEPSGSSARFEPYILRVDYTFNDFYEQEDNGTQSTATPISLGTEYTGTIDGRYTEKDYYTFTVSKDSKVNIEVGPKDVTSSGRWNVYLYNNAAKYVTLSDSSTKTAKSMYLKKGTYYIQVSNNYLVTWKLYTVKVTASPITKVSTPKIKKATIKNSYIYGYLKNIKMSKGLSGDINYEVKVAAKKNMKKPLLSTTSAASKTIKSFKSNSINKKKGTYYVQVRPFVTDGFGGKIYVGAKSKVFKAKAKK